VINLLFIEIIPLFFGKKLLFAPILNYKRTKSDYLSGYFIYLREKVIITVKKVIIKGECIIIKDNFLIIMGKV
jgi:hypothetical protein